MIVPGTIGDLAQLLDARDILVISIRRPSEVSDGQWLVSTKMSEYSLDWHKGAGPDLPSALAACLGLEPPPVMELLV